jgi:hypothetical protein
MAATTYNFTNGSISGQPKVNDTLPNTGGLYSRSNIVDCANQALDAGEGDIAQVINVPADTWIVQVLLRTITAETANGTVDLGVTGVDPDGFGDALAVDAAAGIVATLDVPIYVASADTIDVLATTDTADVDIDGWKFEIVAILQPGNKADNDGDSQAST